MRLKGWLHYAGAVGTGFSEREPRDLRRRLDVLDSPPPAELLVAGDDLARYIHWVRPELIAEVSFTAWSGEGRVRHPVFVGLREDKAPAEVVWRCSPDRPRRVVGLRK